MRILEQDLYIGSVLAQLVRYMPACTIQKHGDDTETYSINDECRLRIDYSTERSEQWQFGLSKADIARACDPTSLMPTFFVFVCGVQSICVVHETELMALLSKGRVKQKIHITLPSTRQFLMQNCEQDLSLRVAVNAFPSSIFTVFLKRPSGHAWPPLCTINVYRDEPNKLFSTQDRHFDLSDLLLSDLVSNDVRQSYVGISTKNPAWEVWDETTKRQIIENMLYQFKFEGVAAEITPVSTVQDAWCTDEFVWKIEYWREPEVSDDLLDEAREIVLSYQNSSTAHLERQLGISYYQASRLMQEIESEGIVSPVRSDGSRNMLIQKDYSVFENCLFLDDQRSAPRGAILCTNAEQAIEHLETGTVTFISFDDALCEQKSGLDVAKHIKKLVTTKRIPMPAWDIHAGAPIRRRKIEAVMKLAKAKSC